MIQSLPLGTHILKGTQHKQTISVAYDNQIHRAGSQYNSSVNIFKSEKEFLTLCLAGWRNRIRKVFTKEGELNHNWKGQAKIQVSRGRGISKYVLFVEMPSGLVWMEHMADIISNCTSRSSRDFFGMSWATYERSIIGQGPDHLSCLHFNKCSSTLVKLLLKILFEGFCA